MTLSAANEKIPERAVESRSEAGRGEGARRVDRTELVARLAVERTGAAEMPAAVDNSVVQLHGLDIAVGVFRPDPAPGGGIRAEHPPPPPAATYSVEPTRSRPRAGANWFCWVAAPVGGDRATGSAVVRLDRGPVGDPVDRGEVASGVDVEAIGRRLQRTHPHVRLWRPAGRDGAGGGVHLGDEGPRCCAAGVRDRVERAAGVDPVADRGEVRRPAGSRWPRSRSAERLSTD